MFRATRARFLYDACGDAKGLSIDRIDLHRTQPGKHGQLNPESSQSWGLYHNSLSRSPVGPRTLMPSQPSVRRVQRLEDTGQRVPRCEVLAQSLDISGRMTLLFRARDLPPIW